MTNEIIEKIERIVERNISARGRSLATPITEPEVQHLFTLTRKLIERIPKNNRKNYSLINFYCDWTLHSKIDRSDEGARILMQIHDIIFDNLKKTDNSNLVQELTSALSFQLARTQLNNLIFVSGGKRDSVGKSIWDEEIIPIFAEIVSNSPLRVDRCSKFSTIINYLRSRPLKATSIVDEIALVKIPRKTFYPEASESEVVFCMVISTTDTTKIVAPLVR